jgi:hypothetical protein
MDILFKNILIKPCLISFIVFTLICISVKNADARYIKKISVETFSEPVEWEKPFKPGIVFSDMLQNSLSILGAYQMVHLKKLDSTEDKKTQVLNKVNGEDNKKNIQKKLINLTSFKNKSLSQYKIRGHILIFKSDTNPLKDGHTKKKAKFHRESAFIKASVEIVNLHTGRLLAKKIFSASSNTGRTIIDLSLPNNDYNSNKFKSHSSGKALWLMNEQVKSFIYKILNELPLEGDLISVNYKNNTAVINLGKINGVKVQDIFTVFSVDPVFNDPIDKVDLGDKYSRKGILKISEVQGRFSKAQIITGIDFVPGDLVVPKHKESKNEKLKKQSHQKDITWGPFMGLSSFSY